MRTLGLEEKSVKLEKKGDMWTVNALFDSGGVYGS
jgi:hypothetical protein